MGKAPDFRLYVSNAEGEINFKNEVCGLWKNETREGGRVYFGGKMKDGRKVQLWPTKSNEVYGDEPKPEQSFAADDVNIDDVPF